MALTIGQLASVSYPAVLAEARKATNQWAESALMRELEKIGAITKKSLGTTIDAPLDYQRNQGAAFLDTDMQGVSLAKTSVVTTAQYTPVPLGVPVTWSMADEALNPTENQKVALVKQLLMNALDSHDDLIEQALFATSTDGFLGVGTIIPTSGQGSCGGIDAAAETWWRNYSATYLANLTDIEAVLTLAWNTAAKGSGSALAPKLLFSGADGQQNYESTLQTLQRFNDTSEADGGYKVLAFKTSRFVFSQYGGSTIFGINPKSFQLVVSKEAFRQKGETVELPSQFAYVQKLFSMLQTVTTNKSRLFTVQSA